MPGEAVVNVEEAFRRRQLRGADWLFRADNQKEEEVAKYGKCSGPCGRDGVQLIGKGLCYKCRAEAIKAGTYENPVPAASPSPPPPPPAPVLSPAQPVSAKPLPLGDHDRGASRRGVKQAQILFHDEDEKIYDQLVASAKIARRTLMAELLIRLERDLKDNG
jgi:hypothetical protein